MAYCTNCGTQNSDAASFCTNCGSPIEKKSGISASSNLSPQPGSSSQSASSKSIITMILGIVSIAMSCGPVTGVAAIIMANQELRAIREGLAPEAGKTLAQIGLWTGWIGTVGCTLFWLAYIGFIVLLVGAGSLWN